MARLRSKGRRKRRILCGGPYDGQWLFMHSAGTLPIKIRATIDVVSGISITKETKDFYGYYDKWNNWVDL